MCRYGPFARQMCSRHTGLTDDTFFTITTIYYTSYVPAWKTTCIDCFNEDTKFGVNATMIGDWKLWHDMSKPTVNMQEVIKNMNHCKKITVIFSLSSFLFFCGICFLYLSGEDRKWIVRNFNNVNQKVFLWTRFRRIFVKKMRRQK